MRTEGFNTRKMGRLANESANLEQKIMHITKSIERLVGIRNRCLSNLNKVRSNMEILAPRLKCEEVKTIKLLPEYMPDAIGYIF